MGAFFGMRGTGDWGENVKPDTWRETILFLNPSGSTVLTGITSMMKSERTDSSKVHWWTNQLSTQAGAVTGVYIDAGLSTEYVYATHHATYGIAGGVVYAKVAEATAKMFREGHQCMLRDADRYDVDVIGKVVGVQFNGASSYIAVRLLEADDNSAAAATYNIATVDKILVTGSINSQGGTRPAAIVYDPTEVYNVTGIYRTAVDLTRTAAKEKLRTGNAYEDAKTQALLYHGVELEKALLWSIRSENTGANGKPENTPMGLLQFIKTYASANVDDYSLSTDTDFKGYTWLQAGEYWLDTKIKDIFSKTPDTPGRLGGERLALCGAGAMLGIQRLVKNTGLYQLTQDTVGYGIKVTRMNTVFGDLLLKIHPLFSWESSNSNSMLIVNPSYLKYRPFADDDTKFLKDVAWHNGEAKVGGKDGPDEEFMTECTWEFYHADTMGYLNGVGLDNTVE
jgi:hypothetical protein